MPDFNRIPLELRMGRSTLRTMKSKPSDMKNYKMMGTYPTPGEAETAMRTMTECK